jgi:hypothetical protein
MSRSLCPVCNLLTQNLESIEVCVSCHHNLSVTTNASVVSTGEFSVSELMSLTEASRAEPVGAPATTTAACSWCGRGQADVRKLLSRGQSHICNACIGLCAEILQAELGDGWAD